MTRRVKRLMLIALGIVTVTLYFGCSQPDDILTSVAISQLNLDVQMLPTAPQGMIYELWVAKNGDTTSLGLFNYDPASKKLLDENGQPRADSNMFQLDGDIFKYDSMLVSVEVFPDPDPANPGPIMLEDKITDPDNNPIELRFPLSDSLWFGILDFCMVTVSDTDRTMNKGAGIWFAAYQFKSDSLRDTVGIDSIIIDNELWNDFTSSSPDTVITTVGYSNINIDTTYPVYGFDTVHHIGPVIDYIYDTFIKGEDPQFLTTDVNIYGQTDPPSFLPPVTIDWDNFIQSGQGLPDYSSYGWRYQGWVVSPAVEDAGASVGKLSSPPWNLALKYKGLDGGLITTGSFTVIDPTDDSIQYAASNRVPPYPGDEFFKNLPNGATGPLNLLPDSVGNTNTGMVFVTLEPDNFVTDTTNFPLVALAQNIPSSRTDPSFDIDVSDTTFPVYKFTMNNHTNTNDPFWGFPKITVGITRR